MNKYEKAAAYIKRQGFGARVEDFHHADTDTETFVFMTVKSPKGWHEVRIHELEVNKSAKAYDGKLVSDIELMREHVIQLHEEILKAHDTSDVYDAAWTDSSRLTSIASQIDGQLSKLQQLLNIDL